MRRNVLLGVVGGWCSSALSLSNDNPPHGMSQSAKSTSPCAPALTASAMITSSRCLTASAAFTRAAAAASCACRSAAAPGPPRADAATTGRGGGAAPGLGAPEPAAAAPLPGRGIRLGLAPLCRTGPAADPARPAPAADATELRADAGDAPVGNGAAAAPNFSGPVEVRVQSTPRKRSRNIPHDEDSTA